MNQETLVLPANLEERRTLLESELQKVAYALIAQDLVPDIQALFAKANVPPIERLTWDFYPESDDEGGTTMYIADVCAYDPQGDTIRLENYTYEKASWRNDGSTFNCNIRDELMDTMYDYRRDLATYEIDELHL